MTEEQVTKMILGALIEKDWTIVSYDFPQSGSGIALHHVDNIHEKNKGAIIPDIIAVKQHRCFIFENKNKVDLNDFRKVSSLIRENHYEQAVLEILSGLYVEQVYYGIGIPTSKMNKVAHQNANLVDFIIGVSYNDNIQFLHNPHMLFL
jgi:hypothetical protein